MSKIGTPVYFSPEKCYNYRKSTMEYSKKTKSAEPGKKKEENPGCQEVFSPGSE